MAVVQKRANALPDLSAAKPGIPPVYLHHGVLRRQFHQVDVANGDSANSTLEVARIPSHAVLSPLSVIRSPGIGGMTDVDLGFLDNANKADVLVNGVTLASAVAAPAMSAVALGDGKKAVWELAGFTRDPQRDISLFLTMKTNATAAGSIVVEMLYVAD